MGKGGFLFGILLGFWAIGVYAQDISDSTLLLEEVLIQSYRLESFSSGIKIKSLDSGLFKSNQNDNLAELLAIQSPIFIKSYGLGSLATPTFRGTGASHTAVIWNGFNLQNPANGQLDFSLIPVFFQDEVKIQYGGGGALFGSGNIGGAIHLTNQSGYQPGFSARTFHQVGSFGRFFQGYQLELGTSKATSSIRIFHTEADNNFKYRNPILSGNPEVELENAGLTQYGILQENFFKIKSTQQLSLRFWYQESDREIPPTMTEASGSSSQQDRFFRVAAEWSKTLKDHEIFVRTAFFDEEIMFEDISINLNSTNQTLASKTELEGRFMLRDLIKLNVGLNNTYNVGRADNFESSVDQHSIALFNSLKFLSAGGKLNGVISMRQELVDGELAPFSPAFGIELIPSKNISLSGNVSRNYRIPTFNDLYWIGAGARGNQNLQSEKGWSEELNVAWKKENGQKSIQASATVFNSQIDNWILWSPDSTNVWSPNNVLAVHSRGLELDLSYQIFLGPVQFRLKGEYSYVSSTNQEVKDGMEQTLDKQLIYVPEHQTNGLAEWHWKGFMIRYSHYFAGKRYTTTDNSREVPAYHLGDLTLAKHFGIKKIKWQLAFDIDNLWDNEYQVIAFRPMPGRNFQLKLSIELN